MRGVGPILSVAGSSGIGIGSVLLLSAQGFSLQAVPIEYGGAILGGLVLLVFGFSVTMMSRKRVGRASAAFTLHVSLVVATGCPLLFWLGAGGGLKVAAVMATVLLAQLLTGSILFAIAAFSKAPKGAAFVVSSVLFLGTLGGSIWLAVKVI